MRRQRTLAILAAMAILLGGFGVRAQLRTPVARAAQTWAVQVGADIDTSNGVAANGYFPSAITIAAGDTVSWVFPALDAHTVTFDNGASPPLAVSGRVRDPAAGTQEFSQYYYPRGVEGSNPAFNPKVQISSGVPLGPPSERTPFTLSFTLPGVYRYVDAVHFPGTAGTVIVLAAGSALPETPAQSTARGNDELASAASLRANPPAEAAGATLAVHNVTAGWTNGNGIVLQQFLNKDITVQRGDTVVWTSANADAHSVTFLSGGSEPQMVNVVPQADGAAKLVRPANVYSRTGGTTYTGQGYLNSGYLSDGGSFVAVIDAPPGTYDYLCLLHVIEANENMRGTITVIP